MYLRVVACSRTYFLRRSELKIPSRQSTQVDRVSHVLFKVKAWFTANLALTVRFRTIVNRDAITIRSQANAYISTPDSDAWAAKLDKMANDVGNAENRKD